jgi:KaiC/GvpD/RAD55 family RecA-like ATPase
MILSIISRLSYHREGHALGRAGSVAKLRRVPLDSSIHVHIYDEMGMLVRGFRIRSNDLAVPRRIAFHDDIDLFLHFAHWSELLWW